MVEQDVEDAGIDVPVHLRDFAARDSNCIDEPVRLQLCHAGHRTVGADHVIEVEPLGVVQVVDGEPLHPQPGRALGERLPYSGCRESLPVGRRVGLGCDDEVFRHAARVSERTADSTFTLTAGVLVGRVEEPDIAFEHSAQRPERCLLVHVIAVG